MSVPRITPRTLKAGWGSSLDSSNDLHTCYGPGCDRSDSRFLMTHLGPLVDELEKRGYDLSTLRFSVKLKDQPSERNE